MARKELKDLSDETDDDDELAEADHEDPDYDIGFAEQVFDTSRQSYLQSFFNQSRAVLMHPRKFFAAMPPEGGVGSAFIFLTIAAVFFGVTQGLAKLDPWAFVVTMLSSIFLTSMGSYILFFFLGTIFKGKGTLGQTFRVMAYSKATLLFAWISLGPLPLGGIVSIAYLLGLNVIGFEKVHKSNQWVVIGITVTFFLLGYYFKKLTGLS